MHEAEAIRLMSAAFTRSGNGLFTADAELVEIDGRKWAMTIDEFTPEEDRFTAESPERLGANLAVATVSDLLAVGAEPKFYLHAVSVPQEPAAAFLSGISTGISGLLAQLACGFCGGDLGMAATWRYCGFAMGPVTAPQPVTRCIPPLSQTLWISGELGDANLAIMLDQPTPVFELRLAAARLLREHATAGIDTSGGLLDAVWQLHEQSPGVRLEIDLAAVPFAPGVAEAAAAAHTGPEAFLLGGAGEYELLFATRVEAGRGVEEQLRAAGAKSIGRIVPDPAGGVQLYRGRQFCAALTEAPPCPRAAANVEQHIAEVIARSRQISGGAGND